MWGTARAVALAAMLVASAAAGAGFATSDAARTQASQLVIYSPRGVYFAGQQVDVRGAAATGIRTVAVYVREQGDWRLVDVNEDGRFDEDDAISVTENGTWERLDVELSNASRLLALPGRYRIGVIDAVDARNRQGNLSRTLAPSRFVSGTSVQLPLTVRRPVMDGSFVSIGGEVAVEDDVVSVQGIARGMPGVLAVVVDSRGNVVAEQVPASGQYDVFDEDVPLVSDGGQPLKQGGATGLIVALGRDDVAGDGTLPGRDAADASALEAYVESLGSNLGRDQVVALVRDQTDLEPGTDDLVRVQQFRITNERTFVRSVVPATNRSATGIQDIEVGETMLIRGTTNRNPEDNTIRVEVTGGPDAPLLPVASTDEWSVNGRWSVTVDTSGATPGTYRIRVQVGNDTDDVASVRIVPEGERGPTAGRNSTARTPGVERLPSDARSGI